MKKITVVTPCFNEKENIEELLARIRRATSGVSGYQFDVIIIDNKSTDGTRDLLKSIAKKDKLVKIILNTRNFGHIRSPYYGILASDADATVYMASDLQDPPEMIPDFIKFWEAGYKLVLATKPESKGNLLMHKLRRLYYRTLDRISSINVIKDSTGFGLYDKSIIEKLREINDPYPFLRGLVSELGYEAKLIEFEQPRRLKGLSKNNAYTLYDIAMLGIVSHSMVPIRIGGFVGFLIGVLSAITGLVFLILKLVYWDRFPMGSAPLVVGMFFLFGFLLCYMALIGEYVGSIHTYIKNRPIVVEEERINF